MGWPDGGCHTYTAPKELQVKGQGYSIEKIFFVPRAGGAFSG